MNIFERGIAAISPRWAAGRLRYRAMLDLSVRAYDAAKRDRTTDGWTVTGNSANAELAPALDIVRRRSRDLVRNNPLATSAVRKLASHMIGTGIAPRPAQADRAIKDELKGNWSTFVANSDPEGVTNFFGQMLLATRCVVESGEAILRWYDRPASFASPLQCDVLEPDFLDQLRNEQLSNGHVIVQGVEFDGYGRRVAYWLFDQHPGDSSLVRPRNMISQRVPAESISHIFDRLRPGQVRGIPWFAPVAMTMRDLDDYEFAERMRKKIAACFSVFVKRDPEADPVLLGQSTAETKDGKTTGRKLEKVAPGGINYLGPAESIELASPPGAEGYADYMVAQLHAICAGLGPPYHMLTGDLRQANYSSLREGKLDFWQLLDGWQQFMIIPQICAGAWERINRANARLGRGPRAWSPAAWQVPARAWVDPEKEAKAEDLEFENGTLTWPQAIARRGLDPEETFDELAEWAPKLKALGIDLFGKSSPAAPAAGKQEEEDDGSSGKKSAAA